MISIFLTMYLVDYKCLLTILAFFINIFTEYIFTGKYLGHKRDDFCRAEGASDQLFTYAGPVHRAMPVPQTSCFYLLTR